MKKLLAFALLFSSFNSYAQRGYVERAIEKKYEKEHGEPGAKKGNDWINNHLLNVDVEDSYTFPTTVKMHITSYKHGQKKNESDLQYYFNSAGTIVGFITTDNNRKRKEDQFIIYDYIKNAMIMLNEKDKTGMAMNINAFRSKESIEQRNQELKSGKPKESSTSCKPMGKTKVIRGYTCTGYSCYDLDTDTRSEIWVTKKISFNTQKMDARNPLAAYYRGTGYEGMMMEGNFYDGDELTSTIEVLEVNPAANYTVRTTDYKFNK
jgi:hypothetical protein